MIYRRTECMGIALVLLLLATATLAAAQEVGALTVTTDLKQNTAIVGQLFGLSVNFNYQQVDADKIVGIRLTPLYELHNPTMLLTDPYDQILKPVVNEKLACSQTTGHKKCNGDHKVDFEVYFTEEHIPENGIKIDAYVMTKDGKYFHIVDQYILKVKMIPKSRLDIRSVYCPRPPDTVRVGENVPFRVEVNCVSLLPETEILGTIEVISGGNGHWTWRSPKMSGSSLYVSEPFQVTFDHPGRWKLRATAKGGFAVAEPYEFEVEVVDQPMRVLGPVRIGYPKPPDAVREGERVRFDVSMDYKNFPPGTVGAVVFIDPATGKDLSQSWVSSRPLGGNGTCDFEPIVLTAPAPGTWELDVTIRLPRLDVPGEYETSYTKRISLQVLSETAAPAWNPAAMKAEITRIQKPQGTLKLNEIVPVFVTISYEKFGEQGAVLRADVTERGTTIFAGRVDSILLRDQGTYTFPVISVKAAHTGTFAIQVEIVGPNNRVLATKWTDFTVVD